MKRGQIRVSVVEMQNSVFDAPKSAANTTVAQVVSRMINQAVRVGATDIHIEPRQDLVQIRYRVDGILRQIETLPSVVLYRLTSHIKTLANISSFESRVPQDGHFKVIIDGHQKNVQVLTLPVQNGEKLTMRLYDEAAEPPDLGKLGLWGTNLQVLTKTIAGQSGLVVVAGPTNSGKATSLYGMLGQSLSPTILAATIEDPIKQQLSGIDQTQVNTKLGITFSSGLRALLRHNPNVVMVSDMRDPETTDLVVQTALTGRLLFGAIYSQGAVTGLLRLVNMSQPFLVAGATRAVVGQRLVRTLCPQCKQEYRPDAGETSLIISAFDLKNRTRLDYVAQLEEEAIKEGLGKELLKPSLKGKTISRLFRSSKKGCAACQFSGYKGRTGLFETLDVTESMRHLLTSHAPASALQQEAIKDGMIPLATDGLVKTLRGQTSVEEMLRITHESF